MVGWGRPSPGRATSTSTALPLGPPATPERGPLALPPLDGPGQLREPGVHGPQQDVVGALVRRGPPQPPPVPVQHVDQVASQSGVESPGTPRTWPGRRRPRRPTGRPRPVPPPLPTPLRASLTKCPRRPSRACAGWAPAPGRPRRRWPPAPGGAGGSAPRPAAWPPGCGPTRPGRARPRHTHRGSPRRSAATAPAARSESSTGRCYRPRHRSRLPGPSFGTYNTGSSLSRSLRWPLDPHHKRCTRSVHRGSRGRRSGPLLDQGASWVT